MKIRDLTPRARLGALIGVTAVGALALSGCAGGGTPSANYVEGGTFVYAIATDIGTLDPSLGVTSAALGAQAYAYDPLVNLDADGKIVSGLAKDWKVDGTTVTFTLRDDVTCSDGAKFTATTAKKNIDFIADPKNASPLIAFVPPGVTTEADDASGKLTLTLAGPDPFVLEAISNVGLVCDAGLADRSTLATKTDGTGPFVLDEAVANDHYTYKVRDGYTWGPGGATTAEKGTPAKVEFRVIANETTAANLLLSGEVNAAMIIGPDAARLKGKDLTSSEAVIGESWFNEASDHVTSDPAVRTALVQALDLDSLANVITSGAGKRATQLAVADPAPCQGGDFTSSFPAAGADKAAATLEAAGYAKGADGVYAKDGKPLEVTFIYDSALGTGADAAAELAEKAWADLGIKVDASTLPTDQVQPIMFGTGAWDMLWEPLNVNTPDQLANYLSGPGLAAGGGNFASLDNADYTAAVTKAMGEVGTAGCSDWFSAEAALVKNVDVLPFAVNVLSTFASGAQFTGATSPEPTSIRLTK